MLKMLLLKNKKLIINFQKIIMSKQKNIYVYVQKMY